MSWQERQHFCHFFLVSFPWCLFVFEGSHEIPMTMLFVLHTDSLYLLFSSLSWSLLYQHNKCNHETLFRSPTKSTKKYHIALVCHCTWREVSDSFLYSAFILPSFFSFISFSWFLSCYSTSPCLLRGFCHKQGLYDFTDCGTDSRSAGLSLKAKKESRQQDPDTRQGKAN